MTMMCTMNGVVAPEQIPVAHRTADGESLLLEDVMIDVAEECRL